MIQIFSASAATATCPQVFSGSNSVVSRIRFQVIGTGWTGSITVSAQLLGQKDNGVTSFAIQLPLVNLNDSSDVAAATGAVASGLYEVDVTGMEAKFVHTFTGGSVSAYVLPLLG